MSATTATGFFENFTYVPLLPNPLLSALGGDHCSAYIIRLMSIWTRYRQAERVARANAGEELKESDLECWLKRTNENFVRGMSGLFGERTIRVRLEKLVVQGLIFRRKSKAGNLEHAFEYRLNQVAYHELLQGQTLAQFKKYNPITPEARQWLGLNDTIEEEAIDPILPDESQREVTPISDEVKDEPHSSPEVVNLPICSERELPPKKMAETPATPDPAILPDRSGNFTGSEPAILPDHLYIKDLSLKDIEFKDPIDRSCTTAVENFSTEPNGSAEGAIDLGSEPEPLKPSEPEPCQRETGGNEPLPVERIAKNETVAEDENVPPPQKSPQNNNPATRSKANLPERGSLKSPKAKGSVPNMPHFERFWGGSTDHGEMGYYQFGGRYGRNTGSQGSVEDARLAWWIDFGYEDPGEEFWRLNRGYQEAVAAEVVKLSEVQRRNGLGTPLSHGCRYLSKKIYMSVPIQEKPFYPEEFAAFRDAYQEIKTLQCGRYGDEKAAIVSWNFVLEKMSEEDARQQIAIWMDTLRYYLDMKRAIHADPRSRYNRGLQEANVWLADTWKSVHAYMQCPENQVNVENGVRQGAIVWRDSWDDSQDISCAESQYREYWSLAKLSGLSDPRYLGWIAKARDYAIANNLPWGEDLEGRSIAVYPAWVRRKFAQDLQYSCVNQLVSASAAA
jgi:hypothetical protein